MKLCSEHLFSTETKGTDVYRFFFFAADAYNVQISETESIYKRSEKSQMKRQLA